MPAVPRRSPLQPPTSTRERTFQIRHGHVVARVGVHRAALAGRQALLQEEAHHIHMQAVAGGEQRVARVVTPQAQDLGDELREREGAKAREGGAGCGGVRRRHVMGARRVGRACDSAHGWAERDKGATRSGGWLWGEGSRVGKG